jgi:hypothetical protein
LNENSSTQFPLSGSYEMDNYANVVHNARLTSAEIANLWSSYMQYTMLRCVMKYFQAIATDDAISNLVTEFQDRIEKRINGAIELLTMAQLPIPFGFSDSDVNVDAPPLFSEAFLVYYMRNELRTSLTFNSLNIQMSTRPDVRDFYSACVESTIRLNNKVTDLLISRGIIGKPPTIAIADKVEFIKEPGFLAGFIGEKRPLLAIELAHLYFNALRNDIGHTLILGFRQVASSEEVRRYMEKGINLCDGFIDAMSSKAMEDQISFTFVPDNGITTSTISPFSEKLMMFQVSVLIAYALGIYGVSLAASTRHDLAKTYAQMMIECGQYSEQGVKIMTERGWLEEPPQVPNWEALTH